MSEKWTVDTVARAAGPILTALREIAVERKQRHGGYYLTASEIQQIDDILEGINYQDSYGAAREWKGSLEQGLFRPGD